MFKGEGMNRYKFCFIICVNQEIFLQECVFYIHKLEIPSNYEIDIITIKEAPNITEAYQSAMQASDAKYKIYLHQDLFILNSNFLFDILKIFRNEDIGMLGLVGGETLPESNKWWNASKRYGFIYETRISYSRELKYDCCESYDYKKVEALDGMLLATQVDIDWRVDLFDGWDFYDVSQCQEFIRKGYSVVVPFQKVPWALHDCGAINMQNYSKYEAIFKKEYKSSVMY